MTVYDQVAQFAAERNYSDAAKCLDDARLICQEREYAGVLALVEAASRKLKAIGVLCDINGVKKLEGRAV